MESFPKELPYGQNGSNNGSCWTLFDSFICEDADISKDPPSNNSNTMKSVYSIMRKACDCMPYTTSSSVPSSTDPAKLRKYDNCQLFKKFDCQYPGCSLKYAAFRVKGVIAIYTHGRHDHKPHTSRHGLNLWIKQLLLKQQSPDNRNPCMSVFNYLKNIERCTDPEEASRHNKTHLLHGVVVNETLKRQIDQAWNTLKNDPKWRINVSNVCLKIGSSMESLINYINSDGRKMEVDKFASITSKELEEMSKEELDKIIILDTDIGENEDHSYKYIIWSTKRNLIIIDDIIEMSKTRLVGIQFESDFAHDIVNSYQVGNLGVSDLSKRYHALIWAISVTENQTVASKMTKLIVTILKKRRHIPHKKPFGKSCMTRDKELSDGSLALKAAVEKTDGVDHALCLSHMLRCNYSKSGKGHGSGTKGSCLRYLKSKGVREEDIGTICAVFLLIRFISTEMEWKQLRPLWERECMELLQYLDSKLEEVMDHLFGHYFAFDLKWAYIHEDGEVHSTNGLEKGWDVLRGEVDHLQKNDLLTKNDSRLSSLLTATSQWNHRLHNKPFVKAPLQHKCDWDAINEFRLEFPFELCLSVCYSLDSQELVTSFEVDDDRHSYVFYFPSEAIIERCRSAIDQKTNPMKSHRPSRNQATITRVSFDNNTGVQVAFQDTVNQALYHEHPYVEPSEDTFKYISRRIFRVKKNIISRRLTARQKNLNQDVTAGRYEPTEASEKESLIDLLKNMTDEKL
ncbi:predicted protein [Chaetoceros tenuissimus]|uniref:Uncharacterized protein n=1 Tax=Chaetoceros tenuissimus TaxID=426638 RepID=A0AAD3CT90_9STRA|nr:predicted protein [Chaetoceros tenuissimus]